MFSTKLVWYTHDVKENCQSCSFFNVLTCALILKTKFQFIIMCKLLSVFLFSILGSDIKGDSFVPDSSVSMSLEDHALYFFEKYSKDLLVEVGIYNIA